MYEPALRLEQAPARPYLRAVDWSGLRDELTPMLGFVLVYALGAQALLLVARLHFSPATVWLSVWIDVLPWLIIPALLIALIHARLSVRDGRGSRIPGWPGWIAGLQRARVGALSPTSLVRVTTVIVVFPVFHRAFAIYKSAIPLILPYQEDSLWTNVDRWIHFGRLPYELLPSFLTTPGALHWLEVLYLGWHAVVGAGILWVTMQSDSALRRRFYFAFVATWVLVGNVAALAASSGGPAYYHALVGGAADPYAALMRRLVLDGTSIPFTTGIRWQLWHHYQMSSVGVGTGISAMPSMHVAMPVLFSLAAYRKDAALCILFALFGVAIFIGSIALGWHYAVDGYVSMVAVGLLWWASGRLVSRH